MVRGRSAAGCARAQERERVAVPLRPARPEALARRVIVPFDDQARPAAGLVHALAEVPRLLAALGSPLHRLDEHGTHVALGAHPAPFAAPTARPR